MRIVSTKLYLMGPPYRRLQPIPEGATSLRGVPDPRGAALVLQIGKPLDGLAFERARDRIPGVPLMIVLPPAESLEDFDDVMRVVEVCRPHSVLPHHEPLEIGDLRSALARSPDDLPAEITDYLSWRGLTVDPDTRRIIRKIVELSANLRTVSALARSLYLSRRALGRRFMQRGLPVPSHWLQASRLIRGTIQLQNRDDNVFMIASGLGYPDGFSLSNQMKRLIGVRPSEARRRLGWEWLLESWLREEARTGGFSKEWMPLFGEVQGAGAKGSPARPSRTGSARGRARSLAGAS